MYTVWNSQLALLLLNGETMSSRSVVLSGYNTLMDYILKKLRQELGEGSRTLPRLVVQKVPNISQSFLFRTGLTEIIRSLLPSVSQSRFGTEAPCILRPGRVEYHQTSAKSQGVFCSHAMEASDCRRRCPRWSDAVGYHCVPSGIFAYQPAIFPMNVPSCFVTPMPCTNPHQ